MFLPQKSHNTSQKNSDVEPPNKFICRAMKIHIRSHKNSYVAYCTPQTRGVYLAAYFASALCSIAGKHFSKKFWVGIFWIDENDLVWPFSNSLPTGTFAKIFSKMIIHSGTFVCFPGIILLVLSSFKNSKMLRTQVFGLCGSGHICVRICAPLFCALLCLLNCQLWVTLKWSSFSRQEISRRCLSVYVQIHECLA